MLTNLSLICIFALTISFNFSNGIHLHSDGGYDISIGFDRRLDEDEGEIEFIDTVKNGINSLSEQLFASTKKKFYIRSAKFVVPSDWSFPSASPEAAPSYENSDLRITFNSSQPSSKVENGNKCGEPGDFIELNRPNFFGTPEAHGPMGKALLKLWARYRWGVYEEHGHPRSSSFPYFSRINNKWELTGCSSVPLKGTVSGPAGRCNLEGEARPDPNCAFNPTPDSTSNSSLMHFHWVNSVVEFCDEHTHDKSAPTRQNRYCEKKSVWEVMRETEDFKAVVAPLDELPAVDFSIVQLVDRPFLHILLDQGEADYHGGIPQAIHLELMKALENIVLFDEAKETQNKKWVSINSYGALDSEELNSILSLILNRTNIKAFNDALNIEIGKGRVEPDFSKAIKQLGENIQEMNHAPGSVVVIVKTSNGPSSFGNLQEYEEEILALFRNQKIIVFAIEMGADHLKNLAEATEGIHLQIDSVIGAYEKCKNVFDELPYILDQHDLHLPERENLRSVMSQSVAPFVNIRVAEGFTILTELSIKLTTRAELNLADISFGGGKFDRRKEYNGLDNTTRFVYFASLTSHPKQDFSYKCDGPPNECEGFLTIVGKYATIEYEDVKVTLSTSLANNMIDYDDFNKEEFENDELLPFTIFVKVTKGGRPVHNLNVKAFGTPENGQAHGIALIDNGDGLIDITAKDGIYTGIFLPNQNGRYSISATVSNRPSAKAIDSKKIENKVDSSGSGFVLPIEQNLDSFYCEIIGDCLTNEIEGNYNAEVKHPVEITVQNIEKNPIGIPDKIVADVKPEEIYQATRDFHLRFNAPDTFGSSPDFTEYRYIFSYAKSQEDIDNGKAFMFHVSGNSFKPGNPEVYKLPHQTLEEDTLLYVVQAREKTSGQIGAYSNVISIKINKGSEDLEEVDKPWLRTTGGILTIIGILVVILVAVGGGYFYQKKRSKKNLQSV